MGGEAFLYPFLVLACALASGLCARMLHRKFGARGRFLQLLLIAFTAPVSVLVLALWDPNVDWDYAKFSIRLSAITSCTIAAIYAIIGLRK